MSKLSKGLFTSDKDFWETPMSLFNKLNARYHFTLDPCSTDRNAKCPKHYTKESNGLTKSWKNEVVFMNPPYGKEISKWVAKASQEYRGGAIIVALLPARTDTKWFHEYINKQARVIFLKGRVKFELNGEVQQTAPFPSMIVIWEGIQDYEL